MADITLVVITLILAITFFVGGIFLNQNKKTDQPGNYLRITGAVLLLFIGVYVLINPVQYVTGEIENNTYVYDDSVLVGEEIVKTNVYGEISSTVSYSLGFVILILGLYALVVTVIKMYNDGFVDYEQEDYE